MRAKFDRQLEKLNDELIEMGSLCEQAISLACKNLEHGDSELIEKVFETDSQIDQMERDIESLCMKLLLQQQPVARDLRTISSALKMISDMERIGDQASDIAEILSVMNRTENNSKLHISEMAQATIHMVTQSVESFVERDIDKAVAVVKYDDKVDELFIKVKKELTALICENADNGEFALDLLMIAKYFERIGDHATNIAQWVCYSITGNHETA